MKLESRQGSGRSFGEGRASHGETGRDSREAEELWKEAADQKMRYASAVSGKRREEVGFQQQPLTERGCRRQRSRRRRVWLEECC